MAEATLAGSTVGKASAAPLVGTDLLRVVRSGVSYKGTLADVATYMATAMAALAVSATTIELGHASDTTISRVSAGRIAVEGSNVIMASDIGVTVQAYDAELTSWASVTRAAGFDTFTATPSSTNLRALLTDETGTGSAVFATSPTLVTPLLGTPTSGTLTNCTGLPVATGISGLGTGIATFLATPTSANLAAAITNETGSGALVFATSPTLVTPLLGTPTSGTLTNCTGLPVSTGISGLATGIATFLATPTSANLLAAVTNETGSGALVFGTSPTIASPTLSGTVAGSPTASGAWTFSSALNLTADPASSYQIDFTNSAKITVANATSATIGTTAFSGIVILHDDTDGGAGVYLCAAGQVFKISGQTKYVANTATPGAGEVSVAYDASANYRIYNNQGSTRTFWVSLMRTRNSV